MANKFRRTGVDFDDLFDPDVMGNGPTAPGCRVNGVPLRYAHISYGTKRADVGYRENGVDVSNKWAQKGSAVYANRGGVPDYVSNLEVVPYTGGTSTAYIDTRADGSVVWTTDSGPASGVWLPGGGGAAYDVKYQNLGTSGGATFFGADNTWRQANTNQAVSLSMYADGGASRTGSGTCNVQYRRRSDGVVVVNYNVNMTATVVSDG